MPDKLMTKSEFVSAVAQKSGVTKKEANAVLKALTEVTVGQLKQGGPGQVTIPGLFKLTLAVKPAVPEHEGINPFTKQPTIFKAKPERKVVKVRVLKGLRDAV
jgi:nucleoid DNA-binding protein